MDFLKGIAKDIGSEYTQLAQDIDETEKFVDTGSYIFNGLVSGSIFGGISGNKITAIAGESSTGKTFFNGLWQLLRTSLIRTQQVVLYTSTPSLQSLVPFYPTVGLIPLVFLLLML